MDEFGSQPLLAFAAGLLSVLSPCVLPLLPAYLSLISGITVEELREGSDRAPVRRRVMAACLGFVSGRVEEKLADVPHHTGTLGIPVLDQCYAHFECRVINVMDTGSSTCFWSDVVKVGHGRAAAATGEVMTAAYFRAHIPAEWQGEYVTQLKAAQEFAEKRSREIRAVIWRELAGR